MPGIDILTVGSLLIMAAGQQQGQTAQKKQAFDNMCPFVKTAQINVLPKSKEVRLDTSKTLKQIQSVDVDTIDPYGFHGVTMTQGYMQAGVKLSPTVKFGTRYYPRSEATCIWYDQIDINIEIDPVIVVAREVYNDPCMRKGVVDHEMKHVNVDRAIVNKYSKTMGQKVYDALQERGFRTEPVSRENVQPMADRMQKVVWQILEHEYKKMDLERAEAQREVDNLQEYERVSQLCPDFQKKIPAWASSKKR